MEPNVWSSEVVEKAIQQWGKPSSPWTLTAFSSASEGEVVVDLGCGFGRFYEWLTKNTESPLYYVGVDKSEWMVRKCRQLYGADEMHEFFVHDLMEPLSFIEVPEVCSLLCNSVLIHLPLEEQDVVLSNLADARPGKLTLDIESKLGAVDVSKVSAEMGQPFFRTRNDPEKFAEKFLAKFPSYKVEIHHFPYGETLTRHVFVASCNNWTKGNQS